MTELKEYFHSSNLNKIVLLVILCLLGHLEYEHWRNRTATVSGDSPSMKVLAENNIAMGNEINRLSGEVAKQGERIAKQRDMITLLGACNNENFTAIKNNDNNFMILNPEWTVNHFPNHIQLNEEDRKWFGKFVNEGRTGSLTQSALGSPFPSRSDDE